MSFKVRSGKQWAVFAVALSALGVGACDSDSGGPADSDASTNTMDSGGDSGPTGMTCGTTFCEDRELAVGSVPACCAGEDGDVCGNNYDSLQMVTGFGGCIALNQPGGANADICGTFFDAIDSNPGPEDTNQSFDQLIAGNLVPLAPCCTSQGVCGLQLDSILGQDLSLGCLPFTTVVPPSAPMGDGGMGDGGMGDGGMGDGGMGDGGMPAPPPGLPFCQPANASAPACVPGVTLPTGMTVTEDFCAYMGLPLPDGTPNDPGECFAMEGQMMSPVVCGCGEGVSPAPDNNGDGLPDCIQNIAKDVCGCADLDADKGNCQKGAKEYMCGCGEDKQWTGLGVPCFGNVATTVCGCDEVEVDKQDTPEDPEDDCLMGVAEHLFGCGEGEPGFPFNTDMCLKNVDAFYGCDTLATPCAPYVPEYLMGCGDGAKPPAPGEGAYCLANIPAETYGCDPVMVAAQVAHKPNSMCGCGDGLKPDDTDARAEPCLHNVPTTLCGGMAGCSVGAGETLGEAQGDCPHAGETCVDEWGPSTSDKGDAEADGMGDACKCSGGGTESDTCRAVAGSYTCVEDRCTCGEPTLEGETLVLAPGTEAHGTCAVNSACQDANADGTYETCGCGSAADGTCAEGACIDTDSDGTGDTCQVL